jgi:hypothetical protein
MESPYSQSCYISFQQSRAGTYHQHRSHDWAMAASYLSSRTWISFSTLLFLASWIVTEASPPTHNHLWLILQFLTNIQHRFCNRLFNFSLTKYSQLCMTFIILIPHHLLLLISRIWHHTFQFCDAVVYILFHSVSKLNTYVSVLIRCSLLCCYQSSKPLLQLKCFTLLLKSYESHFGSYEQFL